MLVRDSGQEVGRLGEGPEQRAGKPCCRQKEQVNAEQDGEKGRKEMSRGRPTGRACQVVGEAQEQLEEMDRRRKVGCLRMEGHGFLAQRSWA